ncbi:hypothetical protein ACG2LH_07095 [Zhouia sp. PK063]|uniref:hypothetical protein n=1 Tax=Zhouia sp. PK063 TaxID=3373602 RepID=UPI0037BD8D67
MKKCVAVSFKDQYLDEHFYESILEIENGLFNLDTISKHKTNYYDAYKKLIFDLNDNPNSTNIKNTIESILDRDIPGVIWNKFENVLNCSNFVLVTEKNEFRSSLNMQFFVAGYIKNKETDLSISSLKELLDVTKVEDFNTSVIYRAPVILSIYFYIVRNEIAKRSEQR